MKYYHISLIENITNILSEGLKANEDNEIYLFENKSIHNKHSGVTNDAADVIATQLGLEEYAMFEINDNGFKSELLNDNVAEMSAHLQWIIKQKKINPKHINLFGTYRTIES